MESTSSPIGNDPPAREPKERLELILRRASDGLPFLEVIGELDTVTSPRLESALGELINQESPSVVLDFGGVTYAGSAGISAIVWGLKRTGQHKGTLVIVSARSELRRVFEITRLDTMLKLYATEQDRLASKRSPGDQ